MKMRKVMKGIGLAMLVAALVAGTTRKAEAIIALPGTTFNLTGTFDDGATLGGTLSIDINSFPDLTGIVLSADATVTPPSSSMLVFDTVDHLLTGPVSGNSYEIALTSSTSTATLDLFLPVGTLAGFSGSQLSTSTIYVDGPHNLQSGSIEPAVSSVPEPATLTLLGIGIAGMAGYGWRRRKLAAA
jgi:hypothetical protein